MEVLENEITKYTIPLQQQIKKRLLFYSQGHRPMCRKVQSNSGTEGYLPKIFPNGSLRCGYFKSYKIRKIDFQNYEGAKANSLQYFVYNVISLQ